MDLSPRTLALGTVYYSVLATRAGHDCYHDRDERDALYTALATLQAEGRVRVHAFACTPWDFRIAFEVRKQAPEEFILSLAESCAPPAGSRFAFAVPLFEDTYRLASLDGHFSLLELVCHIHLTAISAGLATDLETCVASSHRAYRALETIPWLTTRRILGLVDWDPERARRVLDSCIETRAARTRRSQGKVMSQRFVLGDTAHFLRLTTEPSRRSLLSVSSIARSGERAKVLN